MSPRKAVAIVVAALLVVGCAPHRSPRPIEVVGIVQDPATKEPLANTVVEIAESVPGRWIWSMPTHSDLGEVTTGADGRFETQLEVSGFALDFVSRCPDACHACPGGRLTVPLRDLEKPVTLVEASIDYSYGKCKWHGRIEPVADVRSGYATDPETLSKEAAFEFLLSSDEFFTHAIGFAGTPSRQVVAFRVILAEPDAHEAFMDLYERGTLASQLYAVCGFYHTHKRLFRATLWELKSVDAEIRTNHGCVVGSEPLSEALKHIRSGAYPEAFGDSRAPSN